MPLRYVITRQAGEGEQITTEIAQCNPVTGATHHTNIEMLSLFEEAMRLNDTRMVEQNVRMLEAYSLQQYCTPEEWYKINAILDVLAGRMSAATLQHRWKSAKEETEVLEQGRDNAQRMNAQAEQEIKVQSVEEPKGQPKVVGRKPINSTV